MLKKTFYIAIIFLNCGIFLQAQTVEIDADLNIYETKIKQTIADNSHYNYTSYDNKKADSLIVTLASIGTSVTALVIDLTNEPIVYVDLWSDYEEYNGSNSLRIEFENYTLKLNSTEFKKGERILGVFKGKTKPIENSNGFYQIEFDGVFNHIVGKLMIKKRAEDEYIITEH